MLSKLLRHRVATWMAPIARRVPISPNGLTVLGLVAAGAAGALFAVGRFAPAGLAVALSGVLDILDGAVARARRDVPGRFGSFFDSAADRIADNLIYLGILVYFAQTTPLDATAVILTFAAASASNVASYFKARMEVEGLACDAGIFKRQERLVTLILAGLVGPRFLHDALWVLVAFALESMMSRLWLARRELGHPARSRDSPQATGR